MSIPDIFFTKGVITGGIFATHMGTDRGSDHQPFWLTVVTEGSTKEVNGLIPKRQRIHSKLIAKTKRSYKEALKFFNQNVKEWWSKQELERRYEEICTVILHL